MRRIGMQSGLVLLGSLASLSIVNAQQTAATPVFVQPAGNYPIGQLITITDATPGATIYVGVHGVTPTTRGTKYAGPFAVADTETVRAIAVAPGYAQSAMAVAKYTAYPTMTPPTLSPPPGAYLTLPAVTLTGMGSSPGYYIYWTIDGSAPTQSSLRFETPIRITNGTTVSAMAVQPYYFQSPVVSGTYRLKVQTPVITPPGGSQLSVYPVTIGDTTPGASIFYTTDGSMPSSSSTPYAGTISVATAETLQAIATLPGYVDSAVASASFTIPNIVQKIAPVAGNGTAGYTGDGGLAIDATLYRPESLAFNPAGDLYIADSVNFVVRKVSAGSGIITTVAGSGIGGYTGDGGPATEARFEPLGIAVDSVGNFYIADGDQGVVREVEVRTGIITTVAGNPNDDFEDSGTGVPATSFKLNYPVALAFDSHDNLFIADQSSEYLNRQEVFRVDHATQSLTRVAGNSGYATAPVEGASALSAVLTQPTGLALDQNDNLYIADTGENYILEVNLATETIHLVAGSFHWGYTGDGGPATSATLAFPGGVALDKQGNIYIADTYNQVIREVFAGTQEILTIAGNGTGGGRLTTCVGAYGGDGGLATAAELNTPLDVAIAANGDIYIADTCNNAIRKVNAAAPTSSVKKPAE